MYIETLKNDIQTILGGVIKLNRHTDQSPQFTEDTVEILSRLIANMTDSTIRLKILDILIPEIVMFKMNESGSIITFISRPSLCRYICTEGSSFVESLGKSGDFSYDSLFKRDYDDNEEMSIKIKPQYLNYLIKLVIVANHAVYHHNCIIANNDPNEAHIDFESDDKFTNCFSDKPNEHIKSYLQ